MKKYLYFVLIFLVSCSTNVLFDEELTSDQKIYMMSALECDGAKDGEYEGFNERDDFVDFFNGEKKVVVLKYRENNNPDGDRSIVFVRMKKEGEKEYFTVDFEKKTWPYSKCRKLKTEQKYF